MLFFVKDSRNRILYPSKKSRWADKLVKEGKAKWIRRKIIILQLNYPVLEKPRDQISYFVIGMDTGYMNIGFALYKITGKKAQKICSGTGFLRTSEVTELIIERKMYRRVKRQVNRKNNPTPKFKHVKSHRIKPVVEELSKVHTPTCRHLSKSHFKTIDLLNQLAPIEHTHLNIEYASFDTQKITGNKNPHGSKSGMNEKQYVLYRDNYTCRYCGTKKGIFEVHHKQPRSQGGSNKPGNLITLCKKCHTAHHKGKIDANGSVDGNNTKPTTLGVIMPEIYKQLANKLPTYKYYGYETKEFRQQHGIEKSHSNDASCLALMGLEIDEIIDYKIELNYLEFRRHMRAATCRLEDRKYYVYGDPDKKIVAWNRNKKIEADPKNKKLKKKEKPSLVEYRKTHINQKLIAMPGRRMYFNTKYGSTWKTPGAVFRDKSTGVVYVSKSNRHNCVTSTTGVIVKNRDIEWIKRYSGAVFL